MGRRLSGTIGGTGFLPLQVGDFFSSRASYFIYGRRNLECGRGAPQAFLFTWLR